MSLGSISFKTQLLATIVGSTLATAIALTTLSYRAQSASLDRDARRAVHVAAQSRADAIVRLLDGQQQRADRFLVAAAALCGEQTPTGRTAWELACTRRALRDLRVGERAAGAVLTEAGRRIARTGVPVPDEPIPSPLARLSEHDGQISYLIQATNRQTTLRLTFTLDEIAALLAQPVGLGNNGEVFLRDDAGAFLTTPRFGSGSIPPAVNEWSRSCADPVEWADIDYRGVDTLHGIRAVPAFGGLVCVDAHVSHAEALAPASALLGDLLERGGQLAVVGIMLALVAAHWMSVPVQRLAASARALENGDFERPIPIAGPTEVRSLGKALAAMAYTLGDQMTREQNARHDAEAANKAKDEFLAVISHELRTPLTSTLGWTRLLRLGKFDSAQADRALSAIERSAQTQKRLIEDLLDVSRIIAGRLQLERARIGVVDTVRVAVDALRPIAQEKGVVIEMTFESEPTVNADAVRVQQIVTNLVENAIKFSREEGRVTVRVREVERQAEIAVSDTGAGIAPDFLPYVFEPFRQADAGPRRAYRGLGLGLSIVHHLVKLHGGTIEASSQGPGTGATFVVRLPLANAQGAAADGASGRRARLDNLRLLVVEDDDATRRLVEALLEEAGATVDGVATAPEARQRLKKQRYAAIVSDLAMPKEDGYTFMRAVRSSAPHVPALALTGLTRREDAAAALAAGYQVCLTKPIDGDQLVTAIAELTLPKSA